MRFCACVKLFYDVMLVCLYLLFWLVRHQPIEKTHQLAEKCLNRDLYDLPDHTDYLSSSCVFCVRGNTDGMEV